MELQNAPLELNTIEMQNAPFFADFMKKALEGLPPKDFPVPEGIVEKRICQESGALAASACRRVLSEWFRKDTVPLRTCPLHGVPSEKTQDPWAGGQPPKDLLELEGPSTLPPAPALTQPTPVKEISREDQEVSEPTGERTPAPAWQSPAGDWNAEEGF